MSPKYIKQHTTEINRMSRKEMCWLWRFAPAGHLYFRSDLPLFKVFEKRFAKLGKFSPEISKELGQEP